MSPRLVALTHLLERWQALIGIVAIGFVALGFRVTTPRQRIDVLVYEHQKIGIALDSLRQHDKEMVALLRIVALETCLRRSNTERIMLQLPCAALMRPASP